MSRNLAVARNEGNEVEESKGESTRVHRFVGHIVRSEKVIELLDGQAGLSNDRSQCPLGNFPVVGHGQASVWWNLQSQNHVAACPTRTRSYPEP